MVRCPIRAYAILMNQLLDYPAYLDKTLTAIEMSLMHCDRPFTEFISHLKGNNVDLSKLSFFDGQFQFYGFDRFYKVDLSNVAVNAYYMDKPQPCQPIHLLRVIACHLLAMHGKEVLPYVIVLHRKDRSYGYTSSYACVKPVL